MLFICNGVAAQGNQVHAKHPIRTYSLTITAHEWSSQ